MPDFKISYITIKLFSVLYFLMDYDNFKISYITIKLLLTHPAGSAYGHFKISYITIKRSKKFVCPDSASISKYLILLLNDWRNRWPEYYDSNFKISYITIKPYGKSSVFQYLLFQNILYYY